MSSLLGTAPQIPRCQAMGSVNISYRTSHDIQPLRFKTAVEVYKSMILAVIMTEFAVGGAPSCSSAATAPLVRVVRWCGLAAGAKALVLSPHLHHHFKGAGFVRWMTIRVMFVAVSLFLSPPLPSVSLHTHIQQQTTIRPYLLY